MLSTRKQILFVRNLASLLKTGIGLDEALQRLARMLPKQAAELHEMAREVQRGKRLSQVITAFLPEEVIAVIVAGEQSTGLVQVLEEIHFTLTKKLELVKHVGRLKKPLGLMLVGIAIFLGFAVLVIPAIAEATSKMVKGGAGQGPNILMSFMLSVGELVTDYGHLILLVLLASAVALALAWRDEKSRAVLYGMVLSTPLLGSALRGIHFGLWARYLAMMMQAGYDDIKLALMITEKTLPLALREGVVRFRREVELGRSLGVASDTSKLPADDPRQLWPEYLLIAFLIASRTGEIDSQLRAAADQVLEDATDSVTTLLDISNVVVLIIIGISAVLPIMSYLTELVTMVVTAMS